MIEIKMPGKLYIVGEYNVLKPASSAIAVAIDRFLIVTISADKNYSYNSSFSKYKWVLTNDIPQLSFNSHDYSKYALLQAFKYLKYLGIKPKSFKIDVNNDLIYKGVKLGLGSSAALTAGVIKAVAKFHDVDIDLMTLFKLSVLSQIDGNYLSSGGDLATIIYQGWVYYRRYDLLWVLHHKGDYKFIIENDWPELHIENIIANNSFKVKGVWSQVPHENGPINYNITLDRSNMYKEFTKISDDVVRNVKLGLEYNNYQLVYQSILNNDKWLTRYTNHLKLRGYARPFNWFYKLRDQFELAGKISGSGFGDFAIVLSHDDVLINHQIINKAFTKYGFIPFDFTVVER